MCTCPVKLTSNYRAIIKSGRHAFKEDTERHSVQERLNSTECPGVERGGNYSHFKQAGAQDLRKRGLVQARHMVLKNHLVLRIATFYNPLLIYKIFVLSSSRKESKHLPILFLGPKTAQSCNNCLPLCHKAMWLPPGCRVFSTVIISGTTWRFYFKRL